MIAYGSETAGRSRPHDHSRITAPVVSLSAVYAALLVWPEFEPSPSFAPVQWGIHRTALGQFTIIELLVVILILLLLLAQIDRSVFAARLTPAWAMIGVVGLAVLAVSIWTGLANGSTSPFGDWAFLAIGLGTWCALARSQCATDYGRSTLANALIGVTTVWSSWLLIGFLAGGGITAPILGRIPVWDHPSLEFMVATLVLSSWRLLDGLGSPRERLLWLCGAIVPTIVVILSFRRFAWVEMGVGLALIAVLAVARGRGGRIIVLTVVLCGLVATSVALSAPGRDFGARFGSIYTTGSGARGSSYAGTNESHLDDLRDAWGIVARHPILGLGVGATYVGNKTRTWKDISGAVHNGPLNVWIKFGLAGLLLFLTGTFLLMSSLLAAVQKTPLGGGVFCYLSGQLIVTVTVFSWPFETLAGSILFFTMVSLVLPTSGTAKHRMLTR